MHSDARIRVQKYLFFLVIALAVIFFGYLILKEAGLLRKTETLQTSFQSTSLKEVKMVTVLPKDAIQAIKTPTFESADEAVSEMKPQEQVIGLSINGEQKAYPLNILSVHEIVNDTVGGKPVAVTY